MRNTVLLALLLQAALPLAAAPTYQYIADERGYVNLLEQMLRVMQRQPSQNPERSVCEKIGSALKVECVGVLKESSHRISYMFRRDARTLVMLTRWDYKLDGATPMTPVIGALRVRDQPATLSLTGPKQLAQASNKALWKLTWDEGSVQFEYYAEDAVKSGLATSINPKQIPNDAAALVQAAW